MWTGLVIVLCSGVAAGLTEVEVLRAGAIAFQGILFVLFAGALPLSTISNHATLPDR